MFPADNRSAMMPEPTTAATSSPVPRNSATSRAGRIRFHDGQYCRVLSGFSGLVNTGQGEAQKQLISALKNKEAHHGKHAATSSAVPLNGPPGSGTPQWAVIGWPSQIGQTSFAALITHGKNEIKP